MDSSSQPLDPKTIPQPKIGKYLYWAAIVFLLWMTHYVMHEPPGFVY